MNLTPEQVDQRIAEINLLLSQGCTRNDIAKALHINRQALHGFMKRHDSDIQFHQTPAAQAIEGFYGWQFLATALGISRYEMAKRTGVAYGTLSATWSPDSLNRPNHDTVSKVAEGLGLPIAAVYLYLYEITPADMPAIMAALKAQGIELKGLDE